MLSFNIKNIRFLFNIVFFILALIYFVYFIDLKSIIINLRKKLDYQLLIYLFLIFTLQLTFGLFRLKKILILFDASKQIRSLIAPITLSYLVEKISFIFLISSRLILIDFKFLPIKLNIYSSLLEKVVSFFVLIILSLPGFLYFYNIFYASEYDINYLIIIFLTFFIFIFLIRKSILNNLLKLGEYIKINLILILKPIFNLQIFLLTLIIHLLTILSYLIIYYKLGIGLKLEILFLIPIALILNALLLPFNFFLLKEIIFIEIFRIFIENSINIETAPLMYYFFHSMFLFISSFIIIFLDRLNFFK